MGVGSDAGIYFDANFCVRSEGEAFPCSSEQVFDLRWGEIRRSAAAPMELHHRAFARNAATHALQLALENAKIRRSHIFVFLNDDVARAKQAQALAEGNMHVQGNRRSSPIRLFVHSFEVVGAKGVIPNRGRRVARVPGARAVVSSKKFFAHTEFFAHLVQAWVGRSEER